MEPEWFSLKEAVGCWHLLMCKSPMQAPNPATVGSSHSPFCPACSREGQKPQRGDSSSEHLPVHTRAGQGGKAGGHSWHSSLTEGFSFSFGILGVSWTSRS